MGEKKGSHPFLSPDVPPLYPVLCDLAAALRDRVGIVAASDELGGLG